MFPLVSAQKTTTFPIFCQIGRAINVANGNSVNHNFCIQNRNTGNKRTYQIQGQIMTRSCKNFSCSSVCFNRKFSTSRKNFTAKVNHKKNYYRTLGVTPKCSDARIKQAYYRLSKVYHPDVNKSEEAVGKFHEITEAYEILSNSSLKHIYDSGKRGHVSHSRGGVHRGVKAHPVNFNASGPHQYRRTDQYNHDEWFKNHYSDAFRKSQERKKEENFVKATAPTSFKQDHLASKRVSLEETLLIFISSMFILIVFKRLIYNSEKER